MNHARYSRVFVQIMLTVIALLAWPVLIVAAYIVAAGVVGIMVAGFVVGVWKTAVRM